MCFGAAGRHRHDAGAVASGGGKSGGKSGGESVTRNVDVGDTCRRAYGAFELHGGHTCHCAGDHDRVTVLGPVRRSNAEYDARARQTYGARDCSTAV
jgi:hypothetical protein